MLLQKFLKPIAFPNGFFDGTLDVTKLSENAATGMEKVGTQIGNAAIKFYKYINNNTQTPGTEGPGSGTPDIITIENGGSLPEADMPEIE